MPHIKHRKRTKEIKIRVNEEEHAKLNERKTQQSLATWIRDIALGATPIVRADPDLVRQLGRIGSNLNQIAKRVNTENVIDKEVLQSIKQIELLIQQAVEDNRNASKIL